MRKPPYYIFHYFIIVFAFTSTFAQTDQFVKIANKVTKTGTNANGKQRGANVLVLRYTTLQVPLREPLPPAPPLLVDGGGDTPRDTPPSHASSGRLRASRRRDRRAGREAPARAPHGAKAS